MPANTSGLITSRNHTLLRPIRGLHRREERDRDGLYFAEGIRFVAQAVEARAGIRTLLIAPELLTHPAGRKLAQRLERAGIRTLRVTPEVFHSVALTDNPQGIGVVVRQRLEPLRTLKPRSQDFWLALSRLQSAGNLGTIIRTCDAAGASGVILVDSEVDPYDPSAVRATMGSIFRQRIFTASKPELRRWKELHQVRLMGTSPTGAIDYREARYAGPTVLFLGCERRGLDADEQALCDTLVRIPMVGHADSLNVAVAAGVLIYEVFNQRRAEREIGGDSRPAVACRAGANHSAR
jgi:TrmH family RNA methyltransferase